jgi:YspA, cpYpsA-related SLOG family
MLVKVLMYGDRNWDDLAPIEREVKRLVKQHGASSLLIISGGAPGADTLAEIAATNNNVHCAVVKALWQTRYRGAGPQRNEVMRLLEPDEGIGFHKNIEKSRGTKDMARRLDKAGIANRIVTR